MPSLESKCCTIFCSAQIGILISIQHCPDGAKICYILIFLVSVRGQGCLLSDSVDSCQLCSCLVLSLFSLSSYAVMHQKRLFLFGLGVVGFPCRFLGCGIFGRVQKSIKGEPVEMEQGIFHTHLSILGNFLVEDAICVVGTGLVISSIQTQVHGHLCFIPTTLDGQPFAFLKGYWSGRVVCGGRRKEKTASSMYAVAGASSGPVWREARGIGWVA